MTRVSAQGWSGEARDLVRRVAEGSESVILHDQGKDVAAIIPARDFELFERLIREEEDRLDNEKADMALQEEGFATLAEVKARMGI